ncbi:MAG TPA: GNAT family N-acetyltransferase [Pirellulales bacterium]|jgi:ribosomal-protein-alanine N-acetyltransferase|nr:GNAT family N-acetyltransferase [Pirellulales bacterium]
MAISLQRNRVFLATPTAEGENEFLDAVFGSEALHHPWVFPPRTHEQYLGYLERIKIGRTISNLVRLTAGNQLAGVINLSEPVMGIFQSAYLGFYAFAGCERQGLMTEGLALVLDRAFNELGFHRLEANIQPANAASAALVRRLGFRNEGFSPKYLFIDGAWRDHDRWAILSDEWPARRDQLFASR